MRIGIISDTHDQTDRTRRAMGMLESAGVEAVIHCGDFTTSLILAECAALPLYFVYGNNDVYVTGELKNVADELQAHCLGWGGTVELAGKRIGVTHGHRLTDWQKLRESAVDYLLTGHSHVAHDERRQTTRLINPGALHRASVYTVATLDLTEDRLEFLEVPR